MNLIQFSARKPPPMPVMGTAVDRPDLKQCPIKLNACLWDCFRQDSNDLVDIRGVWFNPEERTRITKSINDVLTHGDLVNAAFARELIQHQWNPTSVEVLPTEADETSKGTSSDGFVKKQVHFLIRKAKRLPTFIGTFSSVAPFFKLGDFQKPEYLWPKKNTNLFQLFKETTQKIARWPFFVANYNDKDEVSVAAIQPPPIAIATESQQQQENHQNIVNHFVSGVFTATVTSEGLDFEGDGVTDYKCNILNPEAIGAQFTTDSNSLATPIAFARYACRLMEELAKTPEKAAQRLKQLNLYDFAFPDVAAYQQHDSYGKNGYRGKQYANLTEAVA